MRSLITCLIFSQGQFGLGGFPSWGNNVGGWGTNFGGYPNWAGNVKPWNQWGNSPWGSVGVNPFPGGRTWGNRWGTPWPNPWAYGGQGFYKKWAVHVCQLRSVFLYIFIVCVLMTYLRNTYILTRICSSFNHLSQRHLDISHYLLPPTNEVAGRYYFTSVSFCPWGGGGGGVVYPRMYLGTRLSIPPPIPHLLYTIPLYHTTPSL